ncbi:MAG: PH domain-containing protein [Solirubrobacterales bacterium]
MSFNLGPGEQFVFEGHPSWRSILDFYAKGALATGVLAALVALWGKVIGDGVNEGLVTVVILVGAAIVALAGLLKRVATRYSITNKRLHIKRGIVSRVVQETRLSRVQDVSYSQSLLQRLLQIGDVDFDTASNDSNTFVFTGVADPGEIVEAVHTATGPDRETALGDEPEAPRPA